MCNKYIWNSISRPTILCLQYCIPIPLLPRFVLFRCYCRAAGDVSSRRRRHGLLQFLSLSLSSCYLHNHR